MASSNVLGIKTTLILSEIAEYVTLVSEFPAFWWPILACRTCFIYDEEKIISQVLFAYAVTKYINFAYGSMWKRKQKYWIVSLLVWADAKLPCWCTLLSGTLLMHFTLAVPPTISVLDSNRVHPVYLEYDWQVCSKFGCLNGCNIQAL